MLSKMNQALLDAYAKGYRVEPDGSVRSPKSKLLKRRTNREGYLVFNILFNRMVYAVRVHRLAAYQKFGNTIFDETLGVRHLNGNPADCRIENLAMGTPSQNMLDRSAEDLIDHAVKAARKRRKFTYAEADAIRAANTAGKGYGKLAKEHGVSKTTIAYIVEGKTYVSKE